MNEAIFQNTFDKLQDFLPKSWKTVVFYAGYTEGSYSMKFYTDCGDGKYIDCFNQEGINKAQLIKLFMSIDKEFSAERKKLTDENKWTVFTMVIDEQGYMRTYFDYTNIDGNTISYEREWKKKYLKY